MNRIKAFGGFWYEFIVGDDWRVAATVVAALAITSGIARTAIPAWWVLPATVAILLPAGRHCPHQGRRHPPKPERSVTPQQRDGLRPAGRRS